MDIKSEGKCLYCEKTYAKSGLSRHLGTHLKKMQVTTKGRKYYHLVVTDKYGRPSVFFLHLLVDAKTKLDELDEFLRAIWLECCGHMSDFDFNEPKDFDFFDMDGPNLDIPLEKKLEPKQTFGYTYDFGSSTVLNLKVLNEYKLAKQAAPITLLSRNEPLKILCHSCQKKPAVVLCSVCLGYESSYFCSTCEEKHAKTCADFDDYAQMPVVNSPRMGVCGYEGGQIDLERDGVYVEK